MRNSSVWAVASCCSIWQGAVLPFTATCFLGRRRAGVAWYGTQFGGQHWKNFSHNLIQGYDREENVIPSPQHQLLLVPRCNGMAHFNLSIELVPHPQCFRFLEVNDDQVLEGSFGSYDQTCNSWEPRGGWAKYTDGVSTCRDQSSSEVRG